MDRHRRHGGPAGGPPGKNGYPVKAYNRSQDKLEALKEEFGLTPCETIAQAVDGADVVFVMVGYPKDVEEVFLGKGGIFENAKEGALLIDMTTSSPSLAQRLYEEGKKKGLRVMDAPVSGGDSGARNGTLSIMVGGDEKDFEEALPLFECMGKNIVHMGPAGFGQHTKGGQSDRCGRRHRGLYRSPGLCPEGRSGAGEDADRHRRRCGRQLAAEQHGSPGAEGGSGPRLFRQALHQGYEDHRGRSRQMGCGAFHAGFCFEDV